MATPGQVQDAVDRLGANLGHAVLIEDARHRPLWWSAQGQVDGTRMRTILQREVAPAAVAYVAQLGLARAEGPVRTPASAEADMLARWCVPMRAERDLLGYLWVLDADETVDESYLPDLEACAALAVDAIVHERDTGGRERRRASLLARLAAGRDDAAARELIGLEELDPDVTVTVRMPPAGGWELRGGLSVQVGAGPDDLGASTSGRPLPLAELHEAVRRARATVRVMAAGATLRTPSWDALGAWHLVVAAPEELRVADVHPGADLLAAQPRPDLMITARAVLDAGGDVARTAELLHIHRTTLYYRIERIEALTGVNLKTGADRDDLHMALRLAAYRLAAG